MTTEPTAVDLDLPLEEFSRTEYPGLVAVATALLGSLESGEDMVQDTMVTSLLRWQSVQRLERPGGWARFLDLEAGTEIDLEDDPGLVVGDACGDVEIDRATFTDPADAWFTLCDTTDTTDTTCWIGHGSDPLVELPGVAHASFLPLGFTPGG